MTNTQNPWDVQRTLMDASEQNPPAVPTLSKNSLLYVALLLEELSETILEGVMPPVARTYGGSPTEFPLFKEVHRELFVVSDAMFSASRTIRNALALLPEFAVRLTREEAIGALDGTTDIAVVNCGYALASGLPGEQGYVEVAHSNLSKRNPDTGKIDKTPDGKWIKGRDFKLPDLSKLLDFSAAK